MGLLLLISVINGKDVYMCALTRSFDPKPYHVIQEVFECKQDNFLFYECFILIAVYDNLYIVP